MPFSYSLSIMLILLIFDYFARLFYSISTLIISTFHSPLPYFFSIAPFSQISTASLYINALIVYSHLLIFVLFLDNYSLLDGLNLILIYSHLFYVKLLDLIIDFLTSSTIFYSTFDCLNYKDWSQCLGLSGFGYAIVEYFFYVCFRYFSLLFRFTCL